jgi:hypothetical protein
VTGGRARAASEPAEQPPIPTPGRAHEALECRGRVREIYGLDFFDERQALAAIRALLVER